MTYCVGMRLDAGLVFLSDSRTNAGIDHVSMFRKMSVYENPGDRVIVLMSSGNLSVSQSALQHISEQIASSAKNIWTAASMYDVAKLVGEAVRAVHERDAKMFDQFRIDFNTSLIVGGQIKGEKCRLFHVYSAGNFIESLNDATYFQIGEAKYGKPILDRVITRHTSLDEATKCALISMDSTLRSNVSVGMPLDLLVYEADKLAVNRFVTIDEKNQYFQMIRDSWAQKVRSIFEEIDAPIWNEGPGPAGYAVPGEHAPHGPLRVEPPASLRRLGTDDESPHQTLASQAAAQRQQ
jgi:putative proteasome-type protease